MRALVEKLLGKWPLAPLTASERLESWRRKYAMLTIEQQLGITTPEARHE